MARSNHRTCARNRGNRILKAAPKMVSLYGYLQIGSDWRDWSHQVVKESTALSMVEAGKASPVTRMVGGAVMVVGYRSLQAQRVSRRDPAALTFSTMRAVINFEPGNRQARLNFAERRQVEKYIAWPRIWDGKNAATVGPRQSDAESRRSEAMISQGYLSTVELRAAA